MQSNSPESSPLRGFHTLIASGLTLMALLTWTLVTPPPRPGYAAPGRVSQASPSPSESPGAAPSGSPALIPSASPSASPSPSGSPSPAPSASPSAEDLEKIKSIIERSQTLNPKLKDYVAGVGIDLNAKLGILRLPIDLHGKFYFKAPDKQKIELENAPALLQKYPQIFGIRPLKPDEHNITLLAEEKLNDREHYVLRFDKKDPGGDYRGQTIWFDRENGTIARTIYNYKDDGRITIDLSWQKASDYTVLDTVNAELDFPKHGVAATGTAKYTDYKFNQGLSDEIFEDKKKT